MRKVWNPNTGRWETPEELHADHEFQESQRERGRGLRVILLGVCFAAGLLIIGPQIVGEGEVPGQRPVSSPATPPPSPTPTYKLPPDLQTAVRVRWAQAPPEYRTTICGFFMSHPRDAVAQGEREGLDRRTSRYVVKFVVGELC